MSTKFTKPPRAGVDLVDSRSLRLVFQLDGFRDRLLDWLLQRLRADGYTDLTARHLAFLGELDCGPNHAAEIARRIGVSRQAVHKSVQELSALGWLETPRHPALGNQKVIAFTEAGERLMAQARQHFAALDEVLVERFGAAVLDDLDALLTTPTF